MMFVVYRSICSPIAIQLDLLLFTTGIVNVIAAMDFFDKNKEKLLQPKGNGGHSSGYSSMY